MGAALFRDPGATIELFSRTYAQGNRAVPLAQVDITPLIDFDFNWTSVLDYFKLIGVTVLETQIERLCHTYIDPTTVDDPATTSGPFPLSPV
jgi:hypothetical protein